MDNEMTVHVPYRRLTSGPGYHWFGYYDKYEFDAADRLVLGMRVDFEDRDPGPDDEIAIGMVDTQEDDAWVDLGTSKAWCWQQGCMLQWLPGSPDTVVWNDRAGDRFVCRVLNVRTGERRTLPMPVYTLTPDGKTAFTPDFRRINDTRPGYGYCGIPDPNLDVPAPADVGIWRMDMASGEPELILSIAEAAAMDWEKGDFSKAKHYFNHLLASPDGSRLEFLHRWLQPDGGHFQTRMMTCKPDGSDLRVVCDSGHASHFIWRDKDHILVCCSDTGKPRMCVIDVHTRALDAVDSSALPSVDGHFSYLPPPYEDWLIDDGGGGSSRAKGAARDLVLHHLPSGKVVPLFSYWLSGKYAGERRVDLHPRVSREGTKVVVDAAPECGRQLYLFDVADVLRAHAK